MVFQGRWVPLELVNMLGWLVLLSLVVVIVAAVWLYFFPPRLNREPDQGPKLPVRHPRKKRGNRKSK